MKKHSTSHKLAAAATMGVMAVSSPDAFASGATFGALANNIVTAGGSLTRLISTFCYIGGAGLGVAGIFKLKNHVDNPGQNPMKDGLVRLGAGGGLLSFPFMQGAMQNAIGGTTPNEGVSASSVVIDNGVSAFTSNQ